MRTRSARALLWALVLFALVGVVAAQGTQRYGYGSGRQLQDADDVDPDPEPTEIAGELAGDDAPVADEAAGDAAGSGAVEPVPEIPEEEEETPEPVESTPEPASTEAVEVPAEVEDEDPMADYESTATATATATKSSSKSSSSSSGDATFVKKKTKRVLYARPNQHPGPCTYCRSAAHRLQTALAAAHRRHHQNNQTHIESARASKEKVPDETYRAFMHGVCEDADYWAHYKSFALETGGTVLAGAGLEWSPTDHDQKTDTETNHADDLAKVCLDMSDAAAEDGLYETWWKGAKAFTGRKWFFQDAYCFGAGQACDAKAIKNEL
jgi:hypothetical protein